MLEFLKGNPEWAVIPTIVLSASSDLDDIKKAYRLGASSYHVKPHTTEELENQLAVINAYWMTCQAPEVDSIWGIYCPAPALRRPSRQQIVDRHR